jgi:60 kDa SS-A/Ro ribonucleoprotein
MSKWNQVISPSKPDTVNRAGGEAFTETPEVALVNLILTSFMKDKFYETAKDEQTRLTGLLAQVDPQFAAKAAIYARKRFGMRSITHFTSAWIAKNVHGSTWARLIKERKLGYVALIRNIRNIAEAGIDDEAFAELLKQLQNPEAIKKSSVMPFRILVAYKIAQSLGRSRRRQTQSKVLVSETALLAEALSAALDLALVNVPELPGRTLVALDRSASMRCAINSRSFGETAVPILVSDVGAIFAAALGKKGADVMTFHDRARYERFNRKDSIVSIAEGITNESGGTNFHSIFQCAQAAYDPIIILSDMQAWIGHTTPADAFKRYCQKHRCNPHVYCLNLVSYGDTQFPADKVYQLAGFSDKVFDTMALLETDRLALVKEIKAIELGKK